MIEIGAQKSQSGPIAWPTAQGACFGHILVFETTLARLCDKTSIH